MKGTKVLILGAVDRLIAFAHACVSLWVYIIVAWIRVRYIAIPASRKQWTHGLSMSVGSKPGSLTHPVLLLLPPLCSKQAESGQVSHAHSHIGLLTWFSCHNFWMQYFLKFAIFKIKPVWHWTRWYHFLPPCCTYFENKSRQTHRQTDGQNDYCNPRCSCTLRVNNTTARRELNILVLFIWSM